MYQRAEAGGSGEARPDQKMGRKLASRQPVVAYVDGEWTEVDGRFVWVADDPRDNNKPSTTQRQVMQRKANAKRRHRDRLLTSCSSTDRGE